MVTCYTCFLTANHPCNMYVCSPATHVSWLPTTPVTCPPPPPKIYAIHWWKFNWRGKKCCQLAFRPVFWYTDPKDPHPFNRIRIRNIFSWQIRFCISIKEGSGSASIKKSGIRFRISLKKAGSGSASVLKKRDPGPHQIVLDPPPSYRIDIYST